MAQREPCCWKWHSSSHHRSISLLFASRRSFFICPLGFRVGLSNHRAWFAPAKTQLAKKALALTNSQLQIVADIHMVRKQFPVPKILIITKIARQTAKIVINLAKRPFVKCGRSPLSFPIFQAGKTTLFETFHPILNGAGTVAEQFRHFVTGFTGTYQQHAVKSVIIARFFGSDDFLLNCHFHNLGILDSKLAHGLSP